MKEKQRLEILLHDENNEKVWPVVLEGFNIGFGRIMDALLKENTVYVKKGKKRIYSIGIEHYRENGSGNYVPSHFQPLITCEKFYNVARELLKSQKDYMRSIVEKLRCETNKRYGRDKWLGELPLTGAIDILFNKNLEYFIGKNPKELLSRRTV